MSTDERKTPRLDEALSGPVPLNLLDQPLDFILAEHHRHRIFCTRLRQAAETRQITRIDADRIVAYLTQDLDLHHADEDEDFFRPCASAPCRKTISAPCWPGLARIIAAAPP